MVERMIVLMGYRYTCLNPKSQLKLTTERVKVLKVTGEQTVQVVVEKELELTALKIDRVQAQLRDLSEHFFADKIIEQGLVQIQVFYVKPDDTLNYTTVDCPFCLDIDFPGFLPGPFVDVQNHLLDMTPNYNLQPALAMEAALLQLKIAGHLLVKTAEWVEIDVVTQVDLFPKQL
jgi:hypothetical protein